MSEVIRPEMQELANALVHTRDTADLTNAQLLAAIVRHFDTRALERAGGNRRNAATWAKLRTKPITTDKQVRAAPPFR
ncbi:hypothetical protein [Nocardia nova]|uniref:hypothetical protein n=1 Tax=Nocardia nova TaxID=37330 RepID=UPI0015E46A6D|nr:hypothetical protein [Nocardia nova]